MRELSGRHRLAGPSLAGRALPEELAVTQPLQRYWAAVPLVAGRRAGRHRARPRPARGPPGARAGRPARRLPTLVLHRRAPLAHRQRGGAVLLRLRAQPARPDRWSGSLLNTVLPVVGIDHPLAAGGARDHLAGGRRRAAALARRASRSSPGLGGAGAASSARRPLRARADPGRRCAVLLAVVGAVRLNNGAGGASPSLAQVLAAAALVALMVRREGIARPRRPDAGAGRRQPAARDLPARLGDHRSRHPGGVPRLPLTNDAQHWQMSALAERLQRLPERQHPADGAGPGDRPLRRAWCSRSCCSWSSRSCRC